jgi:hypothetical protein
MKPKIEDIKVEGSEAERYILYSIYNLLYWGIISIHIALVAIYFLVLFTR